MLADRKLWQAICTGEQALGPVVEESLRIDPPVQAWRRQAKEDAVLEGVTIPAGGRILMAFAAANHDPQQFPEPDAFLPGRRNVLQQVAFGAGTHFCLGNQLARLELTTMTSRVLERLPDLRLVEGAELPLRPANFVSGLEAMPVEFTPTAPVNS